LKSETFCAAVEKQNKPPQLAGSSSSRTENSDVDSMDSRYIRKHANKIMNMAQKAIEKKGSKSGRPPAPIPLYGQKMKKVPSETMVVCNHGDKRIHISISLNTSVLSHESTANTACTCSSSIFSGDAAHVEFFLPKLGLSCNCKTATSEKIENSDNSDPWSLTNILRQWQVAFLESIGITTAEQLILAKRDNA